MSGDLLDILEPPAPAKVTERQVLDALCARYDTRSGNGPRFAFGEHVKSGAGFDSPRVADFMAIDLWPSSGNAIHGFEVKVSRSDWLRELADPTKAEAFRPYVDRWWLVVADAAIVRPGELPDGWGLMALGRALYVVRRAPRLVPAPMPREMQATFARAIAKTAARRAAR